MTEHYNAERHIDALLETATRYLMRAHKAEYALANLTPSEGGVEPHREDVGPDSFSATGKFFVAVDHLTRMTWRWGESCGIDNVSWDATGDSYNENCRADHQKAKRALIEAFHAAVEEKAALTANPSTDRASPPASPDAEKVKIAVEALTKIKDGREKWQEYGSTIMVELDAAEVETLVDEARAALNPTTQEA